MNCLICNKELKAINHLHLRTHHLTAEAYMLLYPNAVLYPEEIRLKIAKGHVGKKVVRTKPMSDQARLNMSIARKGKTFGPSSDEKKAKQRKNWEDNYESRCQGIKDSYTPERIERARQTQKRILAERGYHLARGKETRLEKLVREYYETLGFTVIKQKQTKEQVLGSKRYFDVFVPELNIVVEADGEFWHSKLDRFEIDKAKEKQAEDEGYIFIRISDSQLKRGKEHLALINILSANSLDIKKSNKDILEKRLIKINASLVQV